ncbi:hypothetical protein ACP70R_027733 [Stipagrostis hirtigluma subsp. patula]
MGIVNLNRLMFMQRQKRRRQFQARNRSIASRAKTKRSLYKQVENSLGSQIKRCSGSNLPEDIWCHIHSLMPMRDAAQVACVSQAFVRSWRCHPNLDFSEETLGLKIESPCAEDEKARDFNSKVDRILKNRSGIGVRAFRFHVPSAYNEDCSNLDRLDSWLQIAVKPGIEELSLILTVDQKYNFPVPLLSGGTGDSLRHLFLASCHFHPTAGLGCLRSLTRLQLYLVHITSSELGSLLSGSFALERLELRHCSMITCLRIPCLQRLSYLEVVHCFSLRVIESKAPNLSSVCFAGDLHVQLSLGETWKIKKLDRSCNNAAFYARTELPSSMPNLEALTIFSNTEMVNTPMVPSKFHHLKFLSIALGGLIYDYLSLISFLCFSFLGDFHLAALRGRKERVSVFEDSSDLRMMPEHHHSKLKHVKIINFSSSKSLVELTCHILQSTRSLECLTLDTTHGLPRCSSNKSGKCISMVKEALAEAHRALLAIQTYIKPKVPSTVEFNVLEPCSRCHAAGL